MTRFLANWEVESDIILPNEIPFLRHEHPTGTYIVFLRNLPEKRHDIIFLTMQIVFDAPSLNEAKEVVEPLAKEFLDYLTFASNMRTRLRDIRQIFNWEPGNDANRECHYYTPRDAHNGAPFDALDKPLLDTIGMLQAHSPNPRLRRAMKWFANGVSSRFYDDQFVYFWLVLELIAQNAKDPTPVPDKCPNCQGPLFCETHHNAIAFDVGVLGFFFATDATRFSNGNYRRGDWTSESTGMMCTNCSEERQLEKPRTPSSGKPFRTYPSPRPSRLRSS